MTLNSNNFFKQLPGNWISQKSIYFLYSQMHYTHQEEIQILPNHQNITGDTDLLYACKLNYLLKKKQNYIPYSYLNIYKEQIKKRVNQFTSVYSIEYISKKLLKIELHWQANHLIYNEYIYSITPNLKISVGLLKKSNKYISTVLTSYIKKLT